MTTQHDRQCQKSAPHKEPDTTCARCRADIADSRDRGAALHYSGEESTVTTTSIHPGHSVSGVLNSPEWGDGYTASEHRRLDAALIAKFEELAREKTGDSSISYCAYTSEITYEVWGQTTREHHCTDPKTVWAGGADQETDFAEIAREAGEYIAEHIEAIVGESE